MTPVSNASSYCAVASFLLRYDAREVGDLCGDRGVQVSESALATNAKLLQALKDASGDLESACLVAGKYTPTDLAALTGVAAEFRDRIISDLAAQYLRDRRFYEGERQPSERYSRAQEKLQLLRNGERIFGLQEVMDAGHPTTGFRTEATIERTNLASYQANRFFGVRADRARYGE